MYSSFLYIVVVSFVCFFFFKQKTAYEMRISDWSSDVCSSDLRRETRRSARSGGCRPATTAAASAAPADRSRSPCRDTRRSRWRSEEHTSELQSLMRISYAVFCLKKKK